MKGRNMPSRRSHLRNAKQRTQHVQQKLRIQSRTENSLKNNGESSTEPTI